MSRRLISAEAEQELFDNIKYIYSSEIHNTANDKHEKYYRQKVSIEEDMVMVKWVMDHFLEEYMSSCGSKVIQLAHKIKKYGFHISHCIQALLHRDNSFHKAIELLFCKYYRTEDVLRKIDYTIAFEYDKCTDIDALKSSYGDAFFEKIENYLWTVQLQLSHLNNAMMSKKLTKEISNPNEDRLKINLFNKKYLQDVQDYSTDPLYTLEIRFPEGCKYPYEPPYFYFYKNDKTFPEILCLRVAKRLYVEALVLSFNGIPSIPSVLSLLEKNEIVDYLVSNKEKFLGESDSLFQETAVSLYQEKQDENMESTDAINNFRIIKNRYVPRQSIEENDMIERLFMEKQINPVYINMLQKRMKLPTWSYQHTILTTVQQNQVIIISGETGCGKSTQVPQYILDNWIIKRASLVENKNSRLNIICTQPRRISAVGVATRVAAERLEEIGDIIGYQIRLERCVSTKTRVTFCTVGVLLQRLTTDFDLSDVTHIIVDEVHERSADSDFLLMLLKQIVSWNRTLKVILMSATIKTETFSTYFGNVPIVHVPGQMFPVEQIFLEDLFEKVDFTFAENSKFINLERYHTVNEQMYHLTTQNIVDADLVFTTKPITDADETLSLEKLIARYPAYSHLTQKNLFVMNSEHINFDLIEKTLEWIIHGEHDYKKLGSILVFLPGINDIYIMMEKLHINSKLSNSSVLIPLHSSLSTKEQNRVFMKTDAQVCKIVLSTNLAETSITIEDCTFVIDTGKMKQIRFNPTRDMESLETCWITRTNVMQRKGRAGRVMPGVCIHLYTSHRFNHVFDAEPTPEILRISLEQLVLRIYLMQDGRQINLHRTFELMIDSPTRFDIDSAVDRLRNAGALDSNFKLTPLGHHLAKLPVNVRIGKLILYGTIFCCLDSALTIAACLSYKTPFNVPFDKRKKITNPRLNFLVPYSDHLTVLEAYNAWLQTQKQDASFSETFAAQNFLSVNTLRTLADLKYQFLGLLVSIGFVNINLPARQRGVDRILNMTGPEINVNNKNYKLLQGLLCAALYPNIAIVNKPQFHELEEFLFTAQTRKMTFLTRTNEVVLVHPSSVNINVLCYISPYVVYHEKKKTTKIFISEVSMISTLALILFSGYELSLTKNDKNYILSLDSGWIQFPIESHTLGLLLQELRKELTKLLQQKMQNPLLNILNDKQGKQIIEIIVQTVTKE